MPPFCAPSPTYLLSDRAPEEEPEHQEDDGRAQVITLLVDALNDAEAAAEAALQNDNAVDLGNQAYTSLCYDFPIVSTKSLVALNSSLISSLLDTGKPFFPITRKVTAGLSYLVSAEKRKQTTADGRQQEDGVTCESGSLDITDSDTRTHCLLTLCASVFLLGPALRLAVAHKDEGASLNNFLASYAASTDVQQQEILPGNESLVEDVPDTEGFDRSDEAYNEIAGASEPAELDDDDSDWEPLDAEPSGIDVAKLDEFAPTSEGAKLGWCSLMDKVAHLTSLVPKEVINASVWEELQLTKRLIHALSGLRMLEKKEAGVDVITTAELYTGLLADRLVFGCSSSSVASDLASVISALLSLVEDSTGLKGKGVPKSSISGNEAKTWELLLLITLAKLCTKVGGFPIGSNSAYDSESTERTSAGGSANISSPSPVFVRCLWQSTSSTLLFLQEQLDNSVRVTGSSLQVELVLSILCFMVKYAPGNADLGSMLLGGGFFRTALSVFIKVGTEPRMEVLRQFLLLSIATSSAAADYAAQMSTFRASFLSPDFVEGSFTRPYAVIWPLLLQALAPISGQQSKYTTSTGETEYDAGQGFVATLSRIVKLVEDDRSAYKQYGFLKELVQVHCTLKLLAEATTATYNTSFRLWNRGGSVDKAIGQCQVALGALLVQETESRSFPVPNKQEKVAKKSESPQDGKGELDGAGLHPSSSDGDLKGKRSSEPSGTSEADIVASKTKEILPRMLLLLKQLSSLTRGSRGAKID